VNVTLTVTVELRRESGKFAARDEIVDYLRDRIGEALDEGVDGVGADGDSVYVTDDYSVDEVSPPRRERASKAVGRGRQA
jgi:hypothetical protein